MALYLIGDVQGCDEALQRLLEQVAFSPSQDSLFMLGDLVNRGPDSVKVLRRLIRYGACANCLLGNHDLHLLAVAYGARRLQPSDTLDDVLNAPDRAELLDWLRQQSLALHRVWSGQEVLMVHAGVLPGWDASQTIRLAQEVQTALQSGQLAEILPEMFGNTPDRWDDQLTGVKRLRVIVNALTRLRFCSPDGQMEFASKEGAGKAPNGYLPWFDVPGRKTRDITLAFGHWSTLGWLGRNDVLAMDTGCVWGGALSAVRIDSTRKKFSTELIQVACSAQQVPRQTKN